MAKVQSKPIPADAFKIVSSEDLMGSQRLLTLDNGKRVTIGVGTFPPIGIGDWYVLPEGEVNGRYMTAEEFERNYSAVSE